MAARNSESVEPVTPPFRSVAFMLSSLGYAISRGFHEVLRPLELEPGEFALLRAVAASDGEAQHALAERLHISPSWMVAVVDELEKRGLLERRPHARDRRVRNLHLTAAGKKLLKQAERQAEQFDREVAEQLGEADRERLLDLLDRVAAGVELQPGAHAAMRERR
ncbi:MAG TPA: MarR family transcriptional regulator [Gaiellaceae bacterium]|jgi:DNA-binding MarR family transcriptional regulator|nr:MarR family transcriptional regulator [Gaiellaceae bacterium]